MRKMLEPDTTTTVVSVDMYGLTGRDNHPTQDLNGATVKVRGYAGFINLEQSEHCIVKQDEPLNMQTAAYVRGEYLNGVWQRAPSNSTVHFYWVVAPNGRTYQMVDYELADTQ